MPDRKQSRRQFFGASAGVTAAMASALADPPRAAAQSAGVKPGDLPDLTIKEVTVYVADVSSFRRLNSSETGEILSVVTNSGHEGNYTIGNRGLTPNWLEWAKPALLGKNVIDLLPSITATTGTKATFGFSAGRAGGFGGAGGRGGGTWPNHYTAAADICMWDLLGKAVNRPVYKILGGTKDRVMAYASSQHLPNVADYVADALSAKEQGYVGYKIHPGGGQRKTGSAIPAYVGHIEEIKTIRKAVGDDFVLSHDPVQRYNVYEAIKVGRVLDELGYAWFEAPILTSDLEGLVELNRVLDLPLHVGEFLYSLSDFAEHIRRGAPTPNMSAALGDAAWMIGMERNSDLVIMSSYAPLFVNVNKDGMQWRTNLIGYDALTSYGSPAYYAQQMFSTNRGDVVLPIAAEGVPTREWQPPVGRAAPGAQPRSPPPPPAQQVPTLFFSATRDTQTGTMYLKVVNRAGSPQPVRVEIGGLSAVEPKGQTIAIGASSPDDTNSIAEPRKIVPVSSEVDGLSANFTRTFPPYSITVLKMKGK